MREYLAMKEQALIELYQLIRMYRDSYGPEPDCTLQEMTEDICERYTRYTKGKDIRTAQNPREAGPRKKYGEAEHNRIKELRASGMTIREVAAEIGCSVEYVAKIVS